MIVGFTIAKVEGPPNHCDCAAEKANTSSDSKVVLMPSAEACAFIPFVFLALMTR